MTIQGISASDPIFGAESSTGQSALGKDAFMKLLVEQMKNQDPLSPTENSAMIAELAQFSSLEEMQQLNDNIVGLAVLQQSNALMSQLTDSSALLGKTVSFLDPNTGTEEQGTVESVRIEDGIAVLNVGGKDVPLVNVTEITADPDPGSDDGGEDSEDGSSE